MSLHPSDTVHRVVTILLTIFPMQCFACLGPFLQLAICHLLKNIFVVVVQVQLSPFSPHHFHFPPPQPSPPPFPDSTPPLVLSMCPLYMFLKTLPLFLPINPSHLPSAYCQIVLNFSVSGDILLACFHPLFHPSSNPLPSGTILFSVSMRNS